MKLAVLRVRGRIGIRSPIKDTLKMLRLEKKNVCVVIDNNPVNAGMIKKAGDYITWGESSRDVFKKLLAKRGRMAGNKKISLSDKELEEFTNNFFEGKKRLTDINVKPFFRLRPPTKGFERGGIKKSFNLGGALGDRKEKINDLLLKMI